MYSKNVDRMNKIDQSNKMIIALLGSGMTDKEIAVELKMKLPTVNKRIKTMLKNYNCRTRTQLVLKLVAFNLAGTT